ncbi:MAG: hypothetical protein AAGF55_04275 [Pseudomonadota bacterium]
MRRTLSFTFVWFFAVTAGFVWAGLDMAAPAGGGNVVLLSSQ